MITTSELALLSNLFIFSGPLLGYWFAGRNESRRDQRAFDRELAARHEGRHEDSERRLFEYQRELLEAMQNAWSELVLSAVSITTFNINALSDQGKYLKVPEELENRAILSRIQFHRLMERVTDDELREELREVSLLLTKLTIPMSATEGFDAKTEIDRLRSDHRRAFDRVMKINETIGVLLRDNLKHQWMT